MKKVLVIDDDGPVRTGLATCLQRHGYAVVEAGNAQTALELAFTERPDIVLSDVKLPGPDGFDILRALRARPETATIPVVIMTGEPQKADARRSMNYGADDFLQKPFETEQLLAALKARLDRQDSIEQALEARTQAERITAEEKIHLQMSALEAAANGIVIADRKGTILWANGAFMLLTGYRPEEVTGQNPRLLKSGQHSREFYADLWQTISAGHVWHGELVNRRKDGSLYHEEMTITPVRNREGEVQHFIAIKQDISRRKQHEEALGHQRDLLQALMDNLPDYIYFKDANCRFTDTNRTLARHLGLQDPADVIGKCDADFFPLQQARQKLVDESCLLATGKPILGLVEKSTLENVDRWVLSTKAPIYGTDGKITGLVGISRDITEIKEAQEELHRKSAFLEAQMNSSIDGILAVDEAGRKTLQNRRLAELFEIPPAIADEANDQVLLEWVANRVQKPREFLEKVRHLYAHPQAVSRDEIVLKNGTVLDRYSGPMTGKNGESYGRIWTFRDVTEERQMEASLRLSEEKFRGLVENFRDAIVTVDPETHHFTSGNPAAIKMFGAKDEAELLQYGPGNLSPERQPDGTLSQESAEQKASGKGLPQFEWRHRKISGEEFDAEVVLSRTEWSGRPLVLATIRDITEQKRAELERQMMEVQLRHAQKLEAIGQLAAGIAHEINTPTQYVGDNTRFVKDSCAAVGKILDSHQQLMAAALANTVTPELLAGCQEILAASDLDYLREQIPQALNETLEGLERVSKIVRAMKEFSHPGAKEKAPADLNKAVESTVTVARNEWKYVADLKLDLDRALPPVPCFLGEFNQAVLNLVVNAAHAIAEGAKRNPGTKGVITVRTRRDGDFVRVEVADTGTGIPANVRSKIFEPFFTTKEVGKGTGQGLAMVYACVVKRHGGTVTFESEVDQGTTFTVRLPVQASAGPEDQPTTRGKQ